MRCKDQINIILCLHSTGSCKLIPVVIGSAKKPRFKYDHPVLPYCNHKNGWNDTKNGGVKFFYLACMNGQVNQWLWPRNKLFRSTQTSTFLNSLLMSLSIYQPLDQCLKQVIREGF